MTSAHAGATRKLDEVGLAPPKGGKACAVCHARKTKCDSVRPACTACRRSAAYAGRNPDEVCCVYYEAPAEKSKGDDDHVLGTLDEGVFQPSTTTKAFDLHILQHHEHNPLLSAPSPHPSRKRSPSPPPPDAFAVDPTELQKPPTPPVTTTSLPPYLQSSLPMDYLSLIQTGFVSLARDLPRTTATPTFDWSIFDRQFTWSKGRGTSVRSESPASPAETPSSFKEGSARKRVWRTDSEAEAAKRTPSLSSLIASSPAASDVSNLSSESDETESSWGSTAGSDFYSTLPELEVVRKSKRRKVVAQFDEAESPESVAEDVDVWMRVFETMQH